MSEFIELINPRARQEREEERIRLADAHQRELKFKRLGAASRGHFICDDCEEEVPGLIDRLCEKCHAKTCEPCRVAEQNAAERLQMAKESLDESRGL